jgi:hypothetical protein
MKKWITAKLAGKTLLLLLILLSVFHLLVVFSIIPSSIVWGGQTGNSTSNLVVLELVSLLITLVFILIIALKSGYLKINKFTKSINIGVWVIGVFFLLNTIGNIASAVIIENLVFGPLTLIMAILALRLALEK